MQYISVYCIRSFFFLFCPCKSLSSPCFPPLRDKSRPRKDIHFSLGNPQFSPIILSFHPLITGGKSPYFSLRDSNGKRIGSRKGPATFLNYPNISPQFPINFFYFSGHILFSPRFLERKGRMRYGRKKSLIGPRKAS